MAFVNVIVDRPTKNLDHTLTYEIPEEFGYVPVGTRVLVPLRHQEEEASIIEYLPPHTKFLFPVKPILSVLEVNPWFTEEMFKTAERLAAYYLCSQAEALGLFTLPRASRKTYESPREQWLRLSDDFSVDHIPARRKKQRELAEYLLRHGPCAVPVLRAQGYSRLVINSLLTFDGVISEEKYSDTKTAFQPRLQEPEIPLTSQQEVCYQAVHEAMTAGRFQPFLLHGVTGSGKTQVYMKLAQDCIVADKIAVVLVPEIILTNQIVQRFVAHFGDEVTVFHSKLTVNERYNNWERIRRKDSHIIIGARSAVFAPTDDIGLLILDEEHDNSYKQESMGRYHARQVALWRGEYFQCPVVLGSATPSVESYYRATETKEYTLLTMTQRIFEQAMPKVTLVDMKEELLHGNYSVLSDAFDDLLQRTLAKKEQMIILLNRRGYSTFIMCRDCGQPIKCPHCDVSLVYHKANDNLRCHYCDYQAPIPRACPHCGSQKIKYFGSGTQKVEEYLRKKYPKARIARLDQDVTAKKGEGEQVLTQFAAGAYDILLGTQMVAKGHDFSKVTAVGILTADSVLHIPVYSSAERTFDLLTQAAGRAGRAVLPGEVVIQTYNPLHYAIIKSKTHDYLGFYEEEMQGRRALAYPPIGHLLHIMVQHGQSERAWQIARKVVNTLRQAQQEGQVATAIEISDPYEETVSRVRDTYRVSVMIRGEELTSVKDAIRNSWIFTQEGMYFDVDPV